MCIEKCKNYCMFNYKGQQPFYCKIHKQPTMVDTRPKCHECIKRASFDGYCQIHRKNKKIKREEFVLLSSNDIPTTNKEFVSSHIKTSAKRIRLTLSNKDKRLFLKPNEILMDDFELDMSLFDRPCCISGLFDTKLITNKEIDGRIKNL